MPRVQRKPNSADKPRVAIVHDWLISGGAERVVYALHELFPEAPIYTSYCTDEWRNKMDGKVITGFLQNWPFSKLRKFIPFLRILWFTHLDLSDYDIVISSSGAEAKGIKVPSTTTHINYCHAPTHYYWSRYDEYLQNPGFGSFDWFARLGLKVLVGPLRKWDHRAAQRPDIMVANSTHTAKAIKKYYNRDADIVFPPIDVERFKQKDQLHKRSGYVIAGRQTPYKRVDLAVLACSKLGLPLTVIGKGPDHERLVSMAGPTVKFETWVEDSDMAKYFAEARGFIFPGIDDFGIVAVEALATGTPLIAYKAGGALDYVNSSKTGVFFTEQEVDSLCEALRSFENSKFDYKKVAKSAERFDTDSFKSQMQQIVNSCS